MKINTKIRETFKEISRSSIEYNNQTDIDRKYFKRFLKIFKEELTEDEQVYVMRTIFEFVHYKSIITDPDNIIQIHNLKLRSVTFMFILSTMFLIIIAMIFDVNDGLNNIVTMLGNVFKLLSL